MKIVTTAFLAVLAAFTMLSTTGCQQKKGPAEKTGQETGKAIDSLGEKAQDSLKRYQDSLEQAKERMENDMKK